MWFRYGIRGGVRDQLGGESSQAVSGAEEVIVGFVSIFGDRGTTIF